MLRENGDSPTITIDPYAESEYLKLEHLGIVLRHLSQALPGIIIANLIISHFTLFVCMYIGEVPCQRTFSDFLKVGYPNLLVVHPGNTVMFVYCCYN